LKEVHVVPFFVEQSVSEQFTPARAMRSYRFTVLHAARAAQ